MIWNDKYITIEKNFSNLMPLLIKYDGFRETSHEIDELLMDFTMLCTSNHDLKWCRWEAGLADNVQYNADGTLKTEIIRAPFIQVE